MQARYYDPVIGRFYSNDPVGTQGHLSRGSVQGFNRYNYAYNNPYKYNDPNGEHPACIATGLAAFACVGVLAVGYGVYEFFDTDEALESNLERMEAEEAHQQSYIDCVRSGGRNCGNISTTREGLRKKRKEHLRQVEGKLNEACIAGTSCGGSIPSNTEENAFNGLVAIWSWITGGDEQKEPPKPTEPQKEENR